MMILIRTTEDRKFWTSKYTDEGEFLKFKSKTKDGEVRDILLNKKHVIEITTMNKEFQVESE